MRSPRCPSAARTARQLLAAVKSADLTLLEDELERAAESTRAYPGLPADRLERLELLQAVTDGMCSALARMRRGLSCHLDGAAPQLRLLKHLAAAR